MNDDLYMKKYIKYKQKYLALKGGKCVENKNKCKRFYEDVFNQCCDDNKCQSNCVIKASTVKCPIKLHKKCIVTPGLENITRDHIQMSKKLTTFKINGKNVVLPELISINDVLYKIRDVL